MTIKEIENYLSAKNTYLDNGVGKAIKEIHQSAIALQDEEQANYCWCLKQIYKIQKGFVSAINSLKNQKYEDSWCMLDQIDIELGYLESNFNIT